MHSPDWVSYAIIFDATMGESPTGVITQAATAMFSTRHRSLFVHLLPSLIPPEGLRGGTAVVVDVLRASTVIAYALAAGCEAVIPCGEIEEAKAVASSLAPGTALLAGERNGLPIQGFDLGNSPEEFTPERCRGKTVVMTTTNGTRAILASREAESVYIASFANLRATAEALSLALLKRRGGHPIHVVCSGTEGFISLEDSLLAGALTALLVQCNLEVATHKAPRLGNDQAIMALTQWLEAASYLESRPLWKLLSIGRGGQNLTEIGRADDIHDCALIDRFSVVALLRRTPVPLRIEVAS
jgi:2-phosphosulfolactate phosphatase